MSVAIKSKCIACGGELEAQPTKNKRSIYVVCVECNAQTFVKSKAGIKKFTDRHGAGWREGSDDGTEGEEGKSTGRKSGKRAGGADGDDGDPFWG